MKPTMKKLITISIIITSSILAIAMPIPAPNALSLLISIVLFSVWALLLANLCVWSRLCENETI